MMKTICAAATFMLISTLSLADSPPFETYLDVPEGFEFKGTVWKEPIESALGSSVADALSNTTIYSIPLEGAGAGDKTYAFINANGCLDVVVDIATALSKRLNRKGLKGCLGFGNVALKRMWCAVSINRSWDMMSFEIANWGPAGLLQFGEVGPVEHDR